MAPCIYKNYIFLSALRIQSGEIKPQSILVQVDMPTDLEKFQLPPGVNQRLQALLDKQDQDGPLTAAERQEAEGLVELAELLSLLRLRSQRMVQEGNQ